jgi:hypothetical protein
MGIDSAYLNDNRNRSANKSISRGHQDREIVATILDTATVISEDFDAWGQLVGLLVDIPPLDASSATLTVAIFPRDATNAEATIFSVATLTANKVHMIWIEEELANHDFRYLFGAHVIKFTSSAAVTDDREIKVHPILRN